MSFQQFDHGGHSLFSNRTRDLSINRLKEAYKEGRNRVQQVYTCRKNIDYARMAVNYGDFNRFDWEEGIEERLKTYSDNFKKLKDEKGIRRRVRKVVRKVDK